MGCGPELYRRALSPQAFPDNAARREVESLPAVCPSDGCTWKGTLKEYEVGRPAWLRAPRAAPSPSSVPGSGRGCCLGWGWPSALPRAPSRRRGLLSSHTGFPPLSGVDAGAAAVAGMSVLRAPEGVWPAMRALAGMRVLPPVHLPGGVGRLPVLALRGLRVTGPAAAPPGPELVAAAWLSGSGPSAPAPRRATAL